MVLAVSTGERWGESYLAKAYVMRLDVVMMVTVAKRRQMSGNISRQMDPARLLVAS